MAIADRTRKVLWGRSGNRCAICRRVLVVDATPTDDESLVGEECHIVSGKNQGPRHDVTFPAGGLDEPENLILLCRVHHKMVDDQHETYTAEVLLRLKAKHEKWVSSRLSEERRQPRARVRRIKENIPSHLMRLTSGRDIMAVVEGACAFSFDHEEPRSEAEVDLFRAFLQEAKDWGDLSGELEAGDRVQAVFRLTTLLRELEESGFWVFGDREMQRLEGGHEPPAPWPVAILRVMRPTNPKIIRVDLGAVQYPPEHRGRAAGAAGDAGEVLEDPHGH